MSSSLRHLLKEGEFKDSQDEYLFFCDSLIEIVDKNSRSNFGIHFDISDNKHRDVFQSADYPTEDVFKLAKSKALNYYVKKLNVIADVTTIPDDKVLVQSEESILMFGNLVKEDKNIQDFFDIDRSSLLVNLVKTGQIKMKSSIIKSQEKVTGLLACKLVMIDDKTLANLEIFIPY